MRAVLTNQQEPEMPSVKFKSVEVAANGSELRLTMAAGGATYFLSLAGVTALKFRDAIVNAVNAMTLQKITRPDVRPNLVEPPTVITASEAMYAGISDGQGEIPHFEFANAQGQRWMIVMPAELLEKLADSIVENRKGSARK